MSRWLNQDDWNQVDRGADNPHRNKPNCHKTLKGGQGLTLGCSAIDDDDDDDGDPICYLL
jgi:hypothetical protein